MGEIGQPDLAAYDEFLASITKGGSPTAYLFRCLVCDVHLSYADFD